MKKLLILFLAAPLAYGQVNLNTTIPAPQVKGILQPANGGFGISTAGLTGCPAVNNGVWNISPSNCATSAAFAITSFTGCNGTVELGYHVVNPTCNATYTGAPTSAALTNTDGISSPTNLSTPYTSGTISGNFSHNAVATTTITLTAVGSTTQTATQAYSWQPRIFGGVAATGATSTVTASGSSALLSVGSTIGSVGLGAESVGSSFGTFSPTGQCVYLLLMGSTHTFVDTISGFPFAMNAPTAVTFTNQNGVNVSMWLYQSTNPLYGNYAPKVTS